MPTNFDSYIWVKTARLEDFDNVQIVCYPCFQFNNQIKITYFTFLTKLHELRLQFTEFS